MNRSLYRRIEVISRVGNSDESIDCLKPVKLADTSLYKLTLVEEKCAISHARADLNPATRAASRQHPNHIQYSLVSHATDPTDPALVDYCHFHTSRFSDDLDGRLCVHLSLLY